LIGNVRVNDNEFSTLSFNYKPAKGVDVYLNFLDYDNAATGENQDGTGTALGARITF